MLITRRNQHHAPLRFDLGIADVHLQQKAVELRFRQRVGAFVLKWILRREHMERAWQNVVVSGNGYPLLLHRLEQCRLRPWTGSVDLVGHQELAKNRPLYEAKMTLSALGLLKHF